LEYFRKPFLAAFIIALGDSFALLLVLKQIPVDTLTLVLFFQGGLGLIVGVGVSLSSAPSIAAVSEKLFGTDPWSKKAERHAEKVGQRWLLASAFLILIGFIVSAI
jgi:hypothetical protein